MSLLTHKMVTNMIHIRVLSHLIYESWMTRISRPLQRTVLEIQRTRTQAERPMTDNTEPTTNMLNYHKQCEMEMLVGNIPGYASTSPTTLGPLGIQVLTMANISHSPRRHLFGGGFCRLSTKALSNHHLKRCWTQHLGFVWKSLTRKSQGFAALFFSKLRFGTLLRPKPRGNMTTSPGSSLPTIVHSSDNPQLTQRWNESRRFLGKHSINFNDSLTENHDSDRINIGLPELGWYHKRSLSHHFLRSVAI